MNQNQSFFKWIKLGLYAVASIFAVFIIWQSKKFFENNYNKHEILESDIDLYKVENDDKNTEQENAKIRTIEEQPIEIHEEVTSIIPPVQNVHGENKEEVLKAQENNTKKSGKNVQESPDTGRQNLDKKKSDQKTQKVKHNDKPNKVKEETKSGKPNSKPKTLDKDEPVSKSVLKNPLFQSYVVQVGAFANINDAKQYQEKVSKTNAASKYRSDISSKNNMHKIFIGYFESHSAAENVCTALKNENVQCFVTKL